MEKALLSFENSSINVCSDRKLSYLKYANDVVVLHWNPSKLQLFLDRLNGSVGTLEVGFAPSKCKFLLQDRIGSKRNLILPGVQLDEVEGFTYLGSFISIAGGIYKDIYIYVLHKFEYK